MKTSHLCPQYIAEQQKTSFFKAFIGSRKKSRLAIVYTHLGSLTTWNRVSQQEACTVVLKICKNGFSYTLEIGGLNQIVS